MNTLTSILSIALSLFILMDAVGNIPIFVALLKDLSEKRQRIVILRELLIALVLILLFYWAGEKILAVLAVSKETIMIGGGIILFLIALKMIFPKRKDFEEDFPGEKEPFIVPLAIPMIAGPAVLAAVMLYSPQETSSFVMISAIVIAWVATTLILLFSSYLKRILGWRGILACERLMGLILILIAIQMFLNGFSRFLSNH